MGEHKGWLVREDKRRGTWRGEVWVPSLKRHRSRSFASAAEARTWAKNEAAGMVTGAPSALAMHGRALVSSLRGDYLRSLDARGRSPSHLANVTRTLDGLEAVAPDLSAQGAGLAIERWLDGLEIAPASRNRKLVEIRAFCNWLKRRDLLDKDPTRVLERADVPDYLRAQFTVAELRTLMGKPDPYRARFALMVYAGLRSEEAAHLRWGAIDTAGKVILVRLGSGRVKRNRERIVPLQDELVPLLGPRGPDDALASYASTINSRLAFKAFMERHGMPINGRSPHSCRHTYAGLMTATGVPGPLLSAYLGHSSAATTMLYTKLAARFVSQTECWPMGRLQIAESKAASQ